MKKRLGKFILKMMGWKLTGQVPKNLKRYVLIAAPHTSNFDFFLALPSLLGLGIKGKYLIKKELFWFPLSVFLKWTGGIPVDRKNKTQEFVEQLEDLMNSNEEFAILFTPEGTRSRVDKWKTGFHRVAKSCDIPILLAFADYEKKEVHCGEILTPTDDLKADLEKLEAYYKNRVGKFPEQFNPEFYERD